MTGSSAVSPARRFHFATIVTTFIVFATLQSCPAQAHTWRCADERLHLSLWSGDVLRGTQMLFAVDGSLWVIELRGRLLRLVESQRGVQATEVLDLGRHAHSTDPEMGATSIAFGPDFDGKSGTIYLAHNWDRPDGRRVGGISRAVLGENHPAKIELIFGPIPSAGAHQVDRLVMDRGDLLVSVGDIWQPALAQRNDDPSGKVLRIPAESLRANRVRYRVEAQGLRSPFALGRRGSDGLVVIGDNGPDVNDALYVLKKGANYGWGAAGTDAEHDAPLYLWRRPISPTDVCFYEARPTAKHRWPQEYEGDLLVVLFNQTAAPVAGDPLHVGRQILRFELDAEGTAVRIRRATVFLTHTTPSGERPLDLAVSPQGDVYLMTFDVDPNASGTSRIYRLRVQESVTGSS